MSRSVFAERDFRLFYFGQAASYLGDGLRTIAIPLLVFQLTGSALNVGLTYALEFFPFGVFSLIGGSLADRLNRKRLMIACDAVRFIIIGSFAVTYHFGVLSLPLLYVGIALHAICGAIFNGGQASSIPYVVGKARATHAVALLQGTEQAVNTIAPPLGGAIFGLIGPLPALIVNATTYLASQLSLTVVHDLGPDQPGGFPNLREMAHDIATGFRFLWADRVMRLLSISSCLGNMIGMMGYVALVPFVKRDLGGSYADVGFVFGAMGFGSVLGAALATRVPLPFGKITIATWIVSTLTWAPLVWTHSLILTMLTLALSSFASGVNIAHIIGWRMRVSPGEIVGRVFGAVRLVVLVGTLPGAIAGGMVADRYGARVSEDIAIAGFVAISIWLASSRALREERR